MEPPDWDCSEPPDFFSCFGYLSAIRTPQNSAERTTIRTIAALNLIVLTVTTVGGFGAIINTLTVPDIRAYNRFSVFLAFFSISGLSLWLAERWRKTTGPAEGAIHGGRGERRRTESVRSGPGRTVDHTQLRPGQEGGRRSGNRGGGAWKRSFRNGPPSSSSRSRASRLTSTGGRCLRTIIRCRISTRITSGGAGLRLPRAMSAGHASSRRSPAPRLFGRSLTPVSALYGWTGLAIVTAGAPFQRASCLPAAWRSCRASADGTP